MGAIKPPKRMIPATSERQLAKYCSKVIVVYIKRNKNYHKKVIKGFTKNMLPTTEKKAFSNLMHCS
jgi:hypothetical protein